MRISSGRGAGGRVEPRWPAWPPAFLPVGRRRLLVRRTEGGSEEGGRDELWESLPTRAPSSESRRLSSQLRHCWCASFSSTRWRRRWSLLNNHELGVDGEPEGADFRRLSSRDVVVELLDAAHDHLGAFPVKLVEWRAREHEKTASGEGKGCGGRTEKLAG